MKTPLLAAILLLALPPAAPAQNPPSHKDLPRDLAQEAAVAAVAACAAQGWNETAVVVNASGAERGVAHGDGTGVATVNIAFRKAFTAATIGRTGAAPSEAVEKAPGAGGGLLIHAGSDFVGAIAAIGAPGSDQDEACARAGIDKIKDRLN
jgi:uncharacterized protein GlcG (DUF336 family)